MVDLRDVSFYQVAQLLKCNFWGTCEVVLGIIGDGRWEMGDG